MFCNEVATREVEKEVPAPKSTGKYVPPGKLLATRTAALGGGGVMSGGGGGRKKKNAPDVTSQEDFPTLEDASSDTW